jgi:peptide/nickel transport system substrate-binding protein
MALRFPVQRSWPLALVAVVATVTMTACSPNDKGSEGGANGEIDTLTVAGKNSVQSLDPALSYDSGTNNYVTYAECETLFRYDDKTQIQPSLGTKLTEVNPTTYTVDLQKDATFWDGNPMTPEDVAYSMMRVKDEKLASPVAGLAASIESVQPSGDHQIKIKLNTPDPVLQFKLVTPIAAVVEKSFVEKTKDFGTSPDKVMCTGPFRPTAWDKGSQTTFERVADYWDSARMPHVKKLVIEEVTNSATMVAGLKSGSIDMTFDLDGRNASQLEGDNSLTVAAGQGNQFNYVSPVLQKGPFSDERVRQALSYAIDRTGLAQAVSGKYGEPLKSAVPPGLSSWGTDKFNAAYDAIQTPLTPDLDKARQLIDEAGAKGLQAEVIVQEGPTADIVGPAIQQAGDSIGLDIKIKKLPTADWAAANFSGIEPRPFDSMLNFWASDYPDLSGDLVVPFSNKYSNVEGFYDPAYQKLVDQWSKAKSQSDEAANLLIQMEQMLADQTVKIPLYVDPTVFVHSSNVGGYTQTKFWFYTNFAQDIKGE